MWQGVDMSDQDKIKALLKRAGQEGLEIRTMGTPATVEVREDGTVGSITGYAIVYNIDN